MGGNLEGKVDITAIGLTFVCVCVCVNVCRGKTHPCNTRVYTCFHICIQYFENAARALCSLALPSSSARLSASLKRKHPSAIDIAADRPPIDILFNDPTRFKEKIGTCSLGGNNRIQRTVIRGKDWAKIRVRKKEIRLCFRRNSEFSFAFIDLPTQRCDKKYSLWKKGASLSLTNIRKTNSSNVRYEKHAK